MKLNRQLLKRMKSSNVFLTKNKERRRKGRIWLV